MADGLSLLVVDDDAWRFAGTCAWLSSVGYTLERATNDAEARHLARAHRPPLILLADRPTGSLELCVEIKADTAPACTLVQYRL